MFAIVNYYREFAHALSEKQKITGMNLISVTRVIEK
jgi:hypothetical protein